MVRSIFYLAFTPPETCGSLCAFYQVSVLVIAGKLLRVVPSLLSHLLTPKKFFSVFQTSKFAKHGVACVEACAEFRRSSFSWVFLLRLK
jgi:hypothetical protein